MKDSNGKLTEGAWLVIILVVLISLACFAVFVQHEGGPNCQQLFAPCSACGTCGN